MEIKATFGTRSVAIRATSNQHAGAALIVLKLSKDPGTAHEVVYNGPLAPALQIAGPLQSNGQAVMPLSRLRTLNQSVVPDQRIPLRSD